jgi:hypothetical protein
MFVLETNDVSTAAEVEGIKKTSNLIPSHTDLNPRLPTIFIVVHLKQINLVFNTVFLSYIQIDANNISKYHRGVYLSK